MRLTLPHTPEQALRLVAAVLTVILVILLGGIGTGDPDGPTYHHYVAMGDSFTAAPYVPLNDVAYGCNRSSNNYPHLVAQALHIEDLEDRSCTGAQTVDLYDRRQLTSSGQSVAPQFTALSAETDLVTVGIGANNGRLYAKMATVCRKMTKVCPLYDQRDQLRAIVDQLQPELVATLGKVRELAPDARVLLIGYPKLLPQRGDCQRLPRFRAQDRSTFRSMNFRLRLAMREAAAEAGVEFVDFYAASIGHDVCARHPWVQGRVGSSRRGAALHPLPAGQAALARLIERTLSADPPMTGEDS
ncbi:MAG: SGNH/GDSL hydrolase family protein [Marmoricola sp.]